MTQKKKVPLKFMIYSAFILENYDLHEYISFDSGINNNGLRGSRSKYYGFTKSTEKEHETLRSNITDMKSETDLPGL